LCTTFLSEEALVMDLSPPLREGFHKQIGHTHFCMCISHHYPGMQNNKRATISVPSCNSRNLFFFKSVANIIIIIIIAASSQKKRNTPQNPKEKHSPNAIPPQFSPLLSNSPLPFPYDHHHLGANSGSPELISLKQQAYL
jgi:hypothetical protein